MIEWKGQAGIEALLSFAFTIAIVSLLAAALIAQRSSVDSRINDVGKINRAEAAARAVEASFNSRMDMRFGFEGENISYRIQGARFLVDDEGNVIEIGGVFGKSS